MLYKLWKDNIITDDQLSTVEEVTQVVYSGCKLTEEQEKVYEVLLKTQEIMAIALKERSSEEQKQLKQHNYKLRKVDSNLIKKMLEKWTESRKQTKTKSAAERKSASRSRQNEEQKEKERQAN